MPYQSNLMYQFLFKPLQHLLDECRQYRDQLVSILYNLAVFLVISLRISASLTNIPDQSCLPPAGMKNLQCNYT